jgi:hypothetical protein
LSSAQVARGGFARIVGLVVVIIGLSAGHLQVPRQIIIRKAYPCEQALIAKRAHIAFQRDPFVRCAALGGDDDRTGQCVFAEKIGGATLDDLDAIDVVQIHIDFARALKHWHAINHNGHTGLLAHVPLIFNTAELDLQIIAARRVHRDAWYGLEHLDKVVNVLLFDLSA